MAVTVDVDLSTQPTLPFGHQGYIFKKASTNLPATILPDATLSALSLGTGVTLDPTFAPGTTSYTAAVANSVDEVTVTATTTDTNATPEFLDASDAALADADDVANGQQVALAVGDTVFKVQVTAADGTTTETYTVTVTRAAQAQEADVLVSNIEQTSAGFVLTNDDFLRAQAFSVPSGDDSTLTSIDILFIDSLISASEINSLSVSVWSADASGHPLSSLHTLTNPASIEVDGAASVSFTAPADATLQAGTTYVLLMHRNAGVVDVHRRGPGASLRLRAGVGRDAVRFQRCVLHVLQLRQHL